MNLVKYPEEKILDIRNSIGSNKFNYILHDNFFEILKYIKDNISKNVFKQKNSYKYKGNFNKNKINRPPLRELKALRPPSFLKKSTDKEDIFKKDLNANLNKLSDKNYPSISKKIMEMYNLNKEEFDFNYFINNLFDKSVMQPTYCPLYVRLCKEFDELDNIIELIREKCETFRLLIQEISDKDDDVLNVNNYDDFCKKNKDKIFKKGFSQFIGELYKNQFIEKEFIQDFMKDMITNIMNKLNNEDSNVDDSITCLVQLIHTCINCKNIKLALVKSRIITMKNHTTLPKKLKFKLMDLLEAKLK